MQVHVSSKQQVNDLVSGLEGTIAAISVTDPDEPMVYINIPRDPYGEQYICRLQFHDLNQICPQLNEVTYFNTEMAREIATFVDVNKEVDHMVVHCEAGVARSPAIAAAICESMNIPHNFFRTHIPNTMVFSILRVALGFRRRNTGV